MEPWKDSCCSMREASAEVGDQDRYVGSDTNITIFFRIFRTFGDI